MWVMDSGGEVGIKCPIMSSSSPITLNEKLRHWASATLANITPAQPNVLLPRDRLCKCHHSERPHSLR